jgi:hypothetical protein
MRWHRGIVGLLAFGVVLGAAGPVGAGGSNWDFDRDRYQPGDQAFAWASVAWEHNSDLGTPDDGPYGAWLLRDGPTHDLNTIPDEAVRVADVEISEGPYLADDGLRYGPHHATVSFTVPDLAPGDYQLIHCNIPCTTWLGDITFGFFRITAGPAATTTTTTAAPVTTTSAEPAGSLVAEGGDGAPPWALALAGAAAVGVVAGGIALLLRDRRPAQRTVKPA